MTSFPGGTAGFVAVALALALLILVQRVRARRAARARIGRDWAVDTHVERLDRRYAARERWDPDPTPADPHYRVDDQTWSDLDLDLVVDRINYAQTGIGAQSLYRALRRPPRTPELGRRRVALADALEADPSGRTECQRVLADFGARGWALPSILWGRRLRPPIPISSMVVLGVSPLLLGAAAYFGQSITLVVLTMVNVVVNVAIHGVTNHRHGPEMHAAVELGRMLSLARALRGQAVLAPTFAEHERAVAEVSSVFGRRGRAVHTTLLGGASAVIRELADYPSAFFMVKVLALYVALRRIDRARAGLCELFDAIGEVDLCISLAKLRKLRPMTPAQLGTDTKPETSLDLRGVTHPLVTDCVANDLRLSAHGLVLTGSNMAGKSTFLRTVGVNTILAQALGVGFFARFEAPITAVHSCMSVADDLLAGHSRYRAEAEAILALTAAASRGPCLFLIDEMFAGTNPIERTAAAHAVARYLSADHIVLLATHDLDLVTALTNDGFVPAYFSELADGDDLRFDYQLRLGAAGRPNAISILRTLGFPAAISADAERFAAESSAN